MIASAKAGVLSQGTIFSCAIAEDYASCRVHGLVITARCDITNDKAEVFNYIPVVQFSDWIRRDGAKILAQRLSRSTFAEMKNQLRQLDLAASVLDTLAPRTVLAGVFEGVDAKGSQKARTNFERACSRYELARECLEEDALTQRLALLKSEAAEASKVIKELCQNAIAEAYFLPSVYPSEDCAGYVALLREIRHMPRRLAASVADGLDQNAYEALCVSDARCRDRIHIAADDFAWPTGVIKSPFAEHLMQRLTLLFSRIGVADVGKDVLEKLQEHVSLMDDGVEG